MPPVSKTTPLPTSANGRRVAAALPLHHDDLGRALRALPDREQRAHAERLELAAPPAPRPRRRARAAPTSRSANSVVVSTLAGSLTRSRVKIDPLGLRRERREGRLGGGGVADLEASPRGSAPARPSPACGSRRSRRRAAPGPSATSATRACPPASTVSGTRAVEAGDRGAGEPRLGRRRAPRQLHHLHRLGGEPAGIGEHVAAAGLGLGEGRRSRPAARPRPASAGRPAAPAGRAAPAPSAKTAIRPADLGDFVRRRRRRRRFAVARSRRSPVRLRSGGKP